MKDPAALNVIERARALLAEFEGVCAALSKARAAAEYLRATLETDEVKHRARNHSAVCQQCRTPFSAHRTSALYCSDACRQAARRERIAS